MLKTPTKLKREERDKKIHAMYCRLLAKPGAMPTACKERVMQHFKVSASTVYQVQKKFNQQSV